VFGNMRLDRLALWIGRRAIQTAHMKKKDSLLSGLITIALIFLVIGAFKRWGGMVVLGFCWLLFCIVASWTSFSEEKRAKRDRRP
jgi:Ca2+/Na+ antiporter